MLGFRIFVLIEYRFERRAIQVIGKGQSEDAKQGGGDVEDGGFYIFSNFDAGPFDYEDASRRANVGAGTVSLGAFGPD